MWRERDRDRDRQTDRQTETDKEHERGMPAMMYTRACIHTQSLSCDFAPHN